VRSGDFDDDGWSDVVVWRGLWKSGEAFELDILLNDGDGSLVLGTSQVFSGTVPSVVEGRGLVLADFNGDGRLDMFVADQGKDAPPASGHQNTLVLSATGGKMVDATGNLPQQSDMTHSAAAADIDGDGDIDLYVGNIWGDEGIGPEVWLNDGTGRFSRGVGRLPEAQADLMQNVYTACLFADVNEDLLPDLILGGHSDYGGIDSVVLLNNGQGWFSLLPDAMPSKPWHPRDIALNIAADDIDGDGYQDLFMVFTKQDYVGRYIQILINNQDGTFRDETSTRLPQPDNDDPWIIWLYLLDLDMDGYLDIVAAPMGDPQGPLFYLDNGDGTYSSLPNVFNIAPDNTFTFLDIDQDGFLDVHWAWGGGADPEWHHLVHASGCPVFLPLVCRNHPVGN
jgi:hypothetical protein